MKTFNSRVIAASLSGAIALAISAASVPSAALAQTYPTKLIQLVVPYPPGGATDFGGRLVADELSKALGQTVVVENRSGGGSLIGATYLARATGDGYTIGLLTGASTVNIPLLRGFTKQPMPYQADTDLVPVSLLQTTSQLLVARSDFPANDIAGVIAAAKAAPGKISFAHTGAGTANQLAGVGLEAAANIKFNMITYRGEQPVLTDLLGKQIDVGVASVQAAASLIKSGQIKIIAGLGDKRALEFPNTPTAIEGGFPGVYGDSFLGVFAPKGTPQPVVDKLAATIIEMVKKPDVRQKLISQGGVPVGNDQAGFVAFLKSERDRTNGLLKLADLSGSSE